LLHSVTHKLKYISICVTGMVLKHVEDTKTYHLRLQWTTKQLIYSTQHSLVMFECSQYNW